MRPVFNSFSFNTIPFCLSLLLASSPPVTAGDIMEAHFSNKLSTVDVELCFDGEAPDRLYRNSRSSADILHNNQPLETHENDGTFHLPSLPEDSCLNWQVQTDPSTGSQNNRALRKIGDDIIMNADTWFWQGPQNRELKVRVWLPRGVSFSTPWAYLDKEGDALVYQPDNTPPGWEAKLAVGHFKVTRVDIPGAQLRLAMPGKLSIQQEQTLTSWIRESATSVSLVSGRFPQPNPQVLLIPSGEQGRADMFGQVLRGGGVAATFYVNQSRPLQEFREGWTATHEFSHMLMPYISSRDRWLSEGLASYYQQVLRARDGRLSPTDAWQGLHDGFERGRKATTGGTLAQATRQGRAATMRVYWSGAAIMLMADMQLREASDEKQSLDSALALLGECCLDNGKTWRASDMFNQLDSLTDTSIFDGLYKKYVDSNGFPDMKSTWSELGITINHKQVTLLQNAPLVAVRNAIMKE